MAEMMSKKKWLRDEELSEGRLQEGLEFEACVGNLDFFGSQPRTWHLVMTQAASEQNVSEHGRLLVAQRGRGVGW